MCEKKLGSRDWERGYTNVYIPTHAPLFLLQIWRCEYCGTENKVDVSEEEIPKDHQVSFIMAPPPVQDSGADAGRGMEDSLVVFCIDISGSMGVTTPVSGSVLSVCVSE